MRTTIRDVAARANVSPSTVSLVLNNRPVPISAGT
ncbi:MAG: LacI family transcriptional regulator, partial [Clostridiales bacterium]|nr:LacI family transcriptional regulator [Clostridiales bacterium]